MRNILKRTSRRGLMFFFAALVSMASLPVEARGIPSTPIPVALPEFHFSDSALDEAYRQANQTVDSAYQAFGDASTAGYRALASAKGQEMNSGAWSEARSSVLNVLRCRALLVDALNTRISLMHKVRPVIDPNELAMLDSIVSASEDGINGTNEITINMLTALVR